MRSVAVVWGAGWLASALWACSARAYDVQVVRVARATGAVQRIDDKPAASAPFLDEGAARPTGYQRVLPSEHDDVHELHRDGRVAMRLPARDARVIWSASRGDHAFMGVSGSRGDEQRAVWLRRDGAPTLTWRRTESIDASFAFITERGPLVLQTADALVAISPTDGATLWKRAWKREPVPFQALDGARGQWILCEREVSALDQATGAVVWRTARGADVTGCLRIGKTVLFSSRMHIYAPPEERRTGALDLVSGKLLWEQGADRVPEALLELDAGHALVTKGSAVAVLDVHTGSIGPWLPLPSKPWRGAPVAANDVFLQTEQHLLRVRLGASPSIVWAEKFPPGTHGQFIRAGSSIFWSSGACQRPKGGSVSLFERDLDTGALRRTMVIARSNAFCDRTVTQVRAVDADYVDVALDFDVLD